MEEIAAAAGVSRQTLYAHFPSREALLDAVIDRLTAEVVATIDSDLPEAGSATEALLRFLDSGWQTFGRYVAVFQDAAAVASRADDDRHAPIRDRLRQLVRRGQDAGEFDPQLSPDWLLAAVIGLAHTAGSEVSVGRMTVAEATAAVRRTALRVVGAEEAEPTPP
ncbi:TetR/AcrR family transcriptional regulator [Allosalinactinospora lopnorensis]|uniref:TetR/AcrR family transcriptional regulator n=1 Tax=Allosalinactinospora lopnorensis TaxID=1352348 RepID=UPI000A6A2531|nr:TetR/AcrR family transcriptional regulator [Allosalinactinospora lopnorensis]